MRWILSFESVRLINKQYEELSRCFSQKTKRQLPPFSLFQQAISNNRLLRASKQPEEVLKTTHELHSVILNIQATAGYLT